MIYQRLDRVFRYFGAHLVPDRAEQERDRAKQRLLLPIIAMVASVLGSRLSGTDIVYITDGVVIVSLAYGVGGLAFYWFLLRKPHGGVTAQYVFMVWDPIMVAIVVAWRPASCGWLAVLLIVVVARTGIRYGLRCMALVWWAAVVSSAVGWSIVYAQGRFDNHGTTFLVLMACLFMATPMFIPVIKMQALSADLSSRRVKLQAMSELIDKRMQFLSMVSHELRTPLQSILSSIELLEMKLGREVDDREIKRLGINAETISAQLNDIITLARGELGVFSIQPVEVSLKTCLADAAESVRSLASLKGLELKTELPEEDVRVVMDKVRLMQIIVNLLSNAVKYTESGSVTIRLVPVAHGDKVFSIEVSDTGVGVGRNDAHAIFETYERGDAKVYPATSAGVGLAVVKLLVDFLGGSVRVTSEVGQGAEFKVCLPLVKARTGGDGMRLLSVGALLMHNEAIAQAAANHGLEVDQVESAGHGMLLLGAGKYRALLVDASDMEEPVPRLIRGLQKLKAERGADAIGVVVNTVGAWDDAQAAVDAVIELPLSTAKVHRLLRQIEAKPPER